MPIDPKRVEAAARAIAGFGPGPQYDEEWAEAKRWPYGEMCLVQAENALAAAYPELASDPPTAWVAPWTPTEAMLDASAKEEAWRPAGHWEAHDAYPVMRDAHTKEQPEDANPTILHTGLVWARPHTKEQT